MSYGLVYLVVFVVDFSGSALTIATYNPQITNILSFRSYFDILIQLHNFLDSSQRQLLHAEILLEATDVCSVERNRKEHGKVVFTFVHV